MKSNREIRAERFKRVAARRTQNVLDSLKSLGKCGESPSYDIRPTDVTKIFDTLEKAIEQTKAQFGVRIRKEFTLE